MTYMGRTVGEFQSTPPVKAATMYNEDSYLTGWISIHAAREGGDCLHPPYRRVSSISIHAAREGGDVFLRKTLDKTHDFNPRRP